MEDELDAISEGSKKSEGFGRYDTKGAGLSLLTKSNRGKGAKRAVGKRMSDPFEDRGFYCSAFVVECYELASGLYGTDPVIDIDYRKVSPKRLQSELRTDSRWKHVGNFVAGSAVTV